MGRSASSAVIRMLFTMLPLSGCITAQAGVAELYLPSCKGTEEWWEGNGFIPAPGRQLVMRGLLPTQVHLEMTGMSRILSLDADLVPWTLEAGTLQGAFLFRQPV